MKFNAGSGPKGNPHVIYLKSGESVSGILVGEPLEYEKAFKAGEKPKFRFRINLVTKVNGALESKILEGGWKLYLQLKEFSESGWNLEECFTRVSRQGSGVNDTTYSAQPLPTKPDSATLEQVRAVPLKNLKEGLPDENAAAGEAFQPSSPSFGEF